MKEILVQMTEKQIMNAMDLLARLYADQMGIKNPIITIKRKEDKYEESKDREHGKVHIGCISGI